MQAKYERLREILAQVQDLQRANAVLSWDRETYMPAGGGPARAEQMATLSRLSHEAFTGPEVGELLESLAGWAADQGYDSDEAALIRVTRRQYDMATKMPVRLVVEASKASSAGFDGWRAARKENNYQLFRPALARLVELTQERTELLGYPEQPYDALLDLREPGLTTRQVEALFAELRAGLVPLVEAIRERQDRVDDAILRQHYDVAKQDAASIEALKLIGFNLEHGRQDLSIHPFTTSFSPNDVRLTNNFTPDNLIVGLSSALHEGGHGLYEQGVSPRLHRTPLAGGTSSGMHESQSRLWENIIGRSREFWIYFLPRLQAYFPSQLADATPEQMYQAVNKAGPSLIRVDADEVTYNLHIMVRTELELAVLRGDLDLKDLADAWHEKYRTYLGITPPDHLQGVLQDIHWSGFSAFGGFAGYTLGNVIGAQLWAKVLAEQPGMPGEIERGNLLPVLDWMRDRIHQHGRKFTPNELLVRATGRELTAQPYLTYIREKFSDLYGL